MKQIFRLKYQVEDEEFNLYFDEQQRAEKFVNAVLEVATDKNDPAVNPEAHIELMVDSDEDIIKAAEEVLNKKGN